MQDRKVYVFLPIKVFIFFFSDNDSYVSECKSSMFLHLFETSSPLALAFS